MIDVKMSQEDMLTFGEKMVQKAYGKVPTSLADDSDFRRLEDSLILLRRAEEILSRVYMEAHAERKAGIGARPEKGS